MVAVSFYYALTTYGEELSLVEFQHKGLFTLFYK